MLEKLLWDPFHLLYQLKYVLNLTFNLIVLVLIKLNKVVFIKNYLSYHFHKVISKDNIFQKCRSFFKSTLTGIILEKACLFDARQASEAFLFQLFPNFFKVLDFILIWPARP